MEYKVIIYGLGEQYNKNVNVIKYHELIRSFKVVGVTAKWTPAYTVLDGYPVIRRELLKDISFDFIVVMSDLHFNDIVEDLIEEGIDRNCIITYRVLQIPELDFQRYVEFKNSRISIISNNCWGGVAYRTLGLECLSPFKNLSLQNEDYLKMIANFQYYMKCELKFCEYAYNTNSHKYYPVMCLDDVKVHCNQDTNADDAAEKWNRRRKKLNYDNLLVEMYTEDRDIMERFLGVDGYEHKICFVPFDVDKENVYPLYLYPGQDKFWETVNSNAGNGANSLCYNLLNLLTGFHSKRGE